MCLRIVDAEAEGCHVEERDPCADVTSRAQVVPDHECRLVAAASEQAADFGHVQQAVLADYAFANQHARLSVEALNANR